MILKRQSEGKWFTRLCERSGVFGSEQALKTDFGKRWYPWMKDQCSKKMGNDYDFDQVPLEFNAWLVFRNVVDLILVNDFTAYCVFALAHFNRPAELSLVDLFRYLGGFALILFNLWVKRDAHRVVKDFAWYWGDFFFLVDKNLTFDGVFEMAPHPMYSVGYAGFYGVAMICNSYTVLYVSLLAHAAQFAFLYLVEEPHIQKTYGTSMSAYALLTSDEKAREILYGGDARNAYFRRDLIVFKNFDWYRSSDVMLALSILWTCALTIPWPGVAISDWFFIGMCLFWRFFHTIVLGSLLHRQSKDKLLTRHFIKFGGSHREAFQHWKRYAPMFLVFFLRLTVVSIYNFSLTMTYCTFVAVIFRVYTLPTSWSDLMTGTFFLRHTLGGLLILLHIWMAVSVFEVLGDFGISNHS